METVKRIDIENIVYRKTGKRIGKFAGNLLGKLIHQDELNEIWETGLNLSAKEFLNHTLSSLKTDFEVINTCEIPSDGRYFYVSNHPFGGLDGMMIASALLQRHEDVGVVVNDLLMHVGPLSPLWIPVNLYGRQQRNTRDEYDAAMSSDSRQILSFPAGFCSRRTNGEVADTRWKTRFIKDAIHYGRKIVPVYVDGQLSNRFYNIHSLRSMLHIKTNIELVLLVDEMFRQRGRHIRIVFGAPVDVNSLEGSTEERSQMIREMVYNLKKEL